MRAKLTSLLMVLCLLMVFAAVVQAAPAGKVTNLEGRADLTAPGQPAKALFIGDAVNVGDILRTKSASKLEVTWIDGSIARLSENSRLKVTEFSMGAKKRSTILSLFRGKVQNIVTGTTKLFGAKGGSKYEVHTPTSVCGVRGTTFFTYHENGISGALFTEGQGFMYSKGQPDNVKPVAPGVLMTVTSANKPPEAKPAKPGDATKLFNATNPSEKKKDDKKGEDKKEGGTGGTSGTGGTTSTSGKDESTGGTKTEDTGSTTSTTTTTTTTETTGTTDTTMLGGDPTATLGTAPPGTLASQIETGTTADTPGTSSPLTNPTTPVAPVVVPVIEPTPTDTFTTLEQSVILGDLTGTLTGSISNTTNTGTLGLTATGPQSSENLTLIEGGTMSDGSTYNAYVASIPGSWNGLFTGLYRQGASAGILRGNLSGIYAEENLKADGIVARAAGAALFPDASFQSFPLLPLLVLQNLAIGQGFDAPVISGPYEGAGIKTDGIVGYATQPGGVLGTWGAETTAGTYVNATGVKSENVYLYHYSYVPDPYAFPIDHFAFGSVTVTDDLAGHTTVSGTDSLTYLDRQYLGKLSLDYRGVYDYSPETSPTTGTVYPYAAVGTGIYNLQPLAWSGDWGPNRDYAYHLPLSLYGNFYDEESQASFMELVAHETGLVGGVAPFWAGTSRLTALGYIVNDGGIPVAGEIVAGPFLWNSGIAAQATTGVAGEEEFVPDAEFTGVTAGVWKDGLMNGSAYAIYKTAAGQAGWLIGKDTLSGLYNSDLGVWKIEGDITPTPKFASLHPELTANLEIFHDIAFGITGGSFGGQGSILNQFSILQTTFYGTRISVYDEEYEQEVERILPLRWGIYDVMAGSGNSFSGKTAGASSWTAKVGGVGPTQMGAPFYYLADITGTWAADETISGQLAGTYMTPLYKGVLSGPFYGLYNIGGTDESGQYGGWIGQSVGTYNVTQKLDHSASWGGGSIFGYYADEGILLTDSSGRMNEVGYAAGLLGGTIAPWSGATAMSAMGLFSVYDDTESKRDSYLWNAFLQGRVPQEINETPSAGGIYEGYSAALWRTDNFTGAIRTIYLTPPDETGKSTAGFLTGSNLTGNIYALNQGSEYDEYDERDYNYSVGLWESAGTLTASAPVVTGLDPATVTSSYGEVDGKISGSFAGVGALINEMEYGNLMFFMNGSTPLTFGVYDLKLGDYPGGTFSGKPAGETAWSGNLGGALSLYNNVDQIYDSGYWIAGASGQWSADGEITGNVTNGKYLTTMQSGTLSGPFYGLYTEMGTDETGVYGTWVGQSVGNYEGTPLQYASATIYTPITSTNRVYSGEYTYPEAYSGYNYSYNSDNTGSMYYYRNLEGGDYYTISYNADGTYSKYDYNTGVTTTGTWQDAEHPTLAFLQTPPDVSSATLQSKGDWVSPFANGSISQALLGGTDSIWNATSTSPAQATMMGQYIPGTSVPSLWNTTAYSYNYLNNTNTTYDGGAYHGWLAGTKLGNSGNANFLGLYINPTGDAGVVRGSLEGPFYPQTGLFVMDGGLYPEDPVVTGIGIAPENLNSSIAQTSDSSGMNLAAMLGTGGSIWTDNQTLETMFIVKESQGQPWGIYRQGFSGRFNPDERGQTTWSGQTGGVGTFGDYNHSINGATGDSGYWLADASGNWWGDGSVDGGLSGRYLTRTRAGVLSGDIFGVHEGQGNTWQATGLGTWSGEPLKYASQTVSAQITSTNRLYLGTYLYPSAPGVESYYSYSYNTDNTGTVDYYSYYEGIRYTTAYHADGTYIKTDYTGATTTGTWQDAEHPTLAFLQTPPDPESATLQSKSEVGNPYVNGSISQALLGGTQSIWSDTTMSTSPAQATMMGQYIPGTSAPSLWNTAAYSYNYLNDTTTTYDGGAYNGWLAGTLAGNSGDANFLGLYINPTGDAGVVRGSLSGPFYPQTGLLVMDGGLYPEEPVVTGIGITPENLYDSTEQTIVPIGMIFAAKLGTGGSIWSDNQMLETLSIVKEGQGQPWGIYRQGFIGRFNPDESGQTTWYGQTGGAGTFGYYNDSINGATGDSGYWLADVDGTLVNSRLDGSLNGWYLTPIRSGDLYGNLSGVYEAKGNTWQATGLGTWSGAPLAYSARVFSGNWAYYNSTSGEEGLVNDDHPIAGLTGGLSPLFGSEADISGLGTYTRSESSPLFTMLLVNADGGPETNPFH